MQELTELERCIVQIDSAHGRIAAMIIAYLDRAGVVSKTEFANTLEGIALDLPDNLERSSLMAMVGGLRGNPRPTLRIIPGGKLPEGQT